MINCKKSNIFAVTYKVEKEVKKQHFVAHSLLEVTANFKHFFKDAEIISINLAADVYVLNTYDMNILESTS